MKYSAEVTYEVKLPATVEANSLEEAKEQIKELCSGMSLNDNIGEKITKIDVAEDFRPESFYCSLPTSDLFQAVCEECSIETVLDMAEQYIPKEEIREFLYSCLGLFIE